MSGFDWSQVQPGDVLAWLPDDSKLTRRVLVEEIEATLTGPDSRYVWGVEVTSGYQLRGRRRLRNRLGRRLFWICAAEVTGTARGDERIAALQSRLETLRGAR